MNWVYLTALMHFIMLMFYINFVVCNVMRGLCNLHDPPASCCFKILVVVSLCLYTVVFKM